MLDKLQNFVNAIRFKSTKNLKGTLSAELVYEDGTIVQAMKKKNLITLTAKQNLLASVYNANQISDPVTKLEIGTGGCIDPAGMYPKPINQTLTSLYTPLLGVPTSYTLNTSAPSVTFLATVDQSTANGQNITEAGLYTAAGVMFNILTFPAIAKTSQFSINFSWEIELV
jgi:hypothetical protein